MSKNISIWKKISLFNEYKKILRDNEFELGQKFNIRIDKAWRIYTVLNVPENLIGEAYSLNKSDIDKISESYIKEYSNKLGIYLKERGLNELFTFYKIDKVGKFAYLIVFGFSQFRSNEYYNNIYFKVIPISLLILLLSYIFLIFI